MTIAPQVLLRLGVRSLMVHKLRSVLSILGVVLGTVLLQVLQNLVNLLGIPSSLNFAVMGGVILLGVIADQELQRRREARIAAKGRVVPREVVAAEA